MRGGVNTPFVPFLIEKSWQCALQEELEKPYMLDLANQIEREYAFGPAPVYPPRHLIFNAFLHTPFDQVKVVIVGQDPYHGAGQAHGLSFSVPHGIKIPPSLQNIYKELESDLRIPPATHGCLLRWTEQGVLLLNATLTVREGEPLSHHGLGWERFTDAALKKLSERESPVVFVLWGKSAQEKCRFLTSRSLILTAAHPSPFSAHSGFFGCKHFSKINAHLTALGKTPVDWRV